MSFEEQNRQAMISYFESGSKGESISPRLGVEVEHFIVDAASKRAIPYDGKPSDDEPGAMQEQAVPGAFEQHRDVGSSSDGVRGILAYLSAYYPQKTRGIEGDLIGVSCDEASLTLEPAAQLEISIAPFTSIDDIVRVYMRFRERIDPYLERQGWELVTQGYHPKERALDLPLIPKQRYRYMDEYFRSLGTHGERMMRASASTQVSVDYVDEADAIRKLRIAQALVPIIASLTDNVERFEGQVPDKALSRLVMWRDVDNRRCGQIPGLFEEGFDFGAYADWLFGACPIFTTHSIGGDDQRSTLRSAMGETAAQAYADALMIEEDIEHLLSMYWPDVRLKRFIEIRPADALPLHAMAGYAALIKGIFYSKRSLAHIEDALGVAAGRWPLDDRYTDKAIESIRERGSRADIRGLSLGQWRELLFTLGRTALGEDISEGGEREIAYLDEFEAWVDRKGR